MTSKAIIEYITVSGSKAINPIATLQPSTIVMATAKGSGVYLWRIWVMIPVPPVEEFPQKTTPKPKPQIIAPNRAASSGL